MKTRNDLINELVEKAQCSIWTNEMAIAFTKTHGEGTDSEKELKVRACEHSIAKDVEYIGFLKGELA